MFESFFPRPAAFFLSAFIWALCAIIFWEAGGGDWLLSVTHAAHPLPISAARFWSRPTWPFMDTTGFPWGRLLLSGSCSARTAGSVGQFWVVR